MLDLEKSGLLWTKKCLELGREMSNYFSRFLELQSGATIVPGLDFTSPEVYNDLAVSITHASSAPMNGAPEALFGIIHPFLARGSLILVEDDLRRPTDPNLQSTAHSETIIGGEVVFHLEQDDGVMTADQLHTFLGASGSGYPLNAFVLSGISRDQVVRALAAENLDALIPSISAIVNTVFDCDSFSVWLSRETFELLVESEIAVFSSRNNPGFFGDSSRCEGEHNHGLLGEP